MEIIRLEEAKEYCDKHKVERNDWVAGAIDKVIAGTHYIHYKYESSGNLVNSVINREYMQSHMQSLSGFDDALYTALIVGDISELESLERDQSMLTIGELADDFEIGIA
ncbi:MAG: hypothetical protein GY928_28560 [Colwellia sp.]|nr:hypothetical protein [Colwellia sp.]